ncbi:hypothetical protein NFI96_018534, partial [Prochilodus magdalenae]
SKEWSSDTSYLGALVRTRCGPLSQSACSLGATYLSESSSTETITESSPFERIASMDILTSMSGERRTDTASVGRLYRSLSEPVCTSTRSQVSPRSSGFGFTSIPDPLGKFKSMNLPPVLSKEWSSDTSYLGALVRTRCGPLSQSACSMGSTYLSEFGSTETITESSHFERIASMDILTS